MFKNRLTLVFLLFSSLVFAQNPYLLVLGTAQDGGFPQAGCKKECCQTAWKGSKKPQMVSCIALIDPQSKQQWIFDATPDFAKQHHLLAQNTQNEGLDGIFISHAHIGHYTGLMHLGREVMGAKKMSVFAMPRFKMFLESNGPWSQLVRLENIQIQALFDSTEVVLNERLKVMPFRVPHRDEFSETVGFRLLYQGKKAVFIPDIDKWQKWNQDLKKVVQENDILLLDGTFYKDGEIARPMSEVPHPFVSESMDLLSVLPENERKKVYFIHLNHTNPLLQKKSEEQKELQKKGFKVAKQGQIIGF